LGRTLVYKSKRGEERDGMSGLKDNVEVLEKAKEKGKADNYKPIHTQE
jgi:hypothetical protein